MISIRMQRQSVTTADYSSVNVDLQNLTLSHTFSSYSAQAITVKSDGSADKANMNINISNCEFEYGYGMNSYGAIAITGQLNTAQFSIFTYIHPVTSVQYQL